MFKPGATTAARARPPEDVLYDIRPQLSNAQRQQRPARRPPTVTDAAATTFTAEHAAAEARRTSSRHLSKPAPQAHGPPPTRPERLQGPPAAPPPPYQPSMTGHMQRMPHYRRRRESPPNPEAECPVRAHPRVHIRARPHSPRTPGEQDYEESPRPATATGLHDPVTPTHAHSSAQDRRPAQGQWWQRWTHTQLWELRKWARGEPSLKGLVHRPRKGSVENCRPRPAGGVDAAGRMGSHAGQCAPTPGSPPPQPPRAPGPPVCPPGDTARWHPPVGHHPKPSPAQTHPLTTPQASAHRHWRHSQHPRSPAHQAPRRA